MNNYQINIERLMKELKGIKRFNFCSPSKISRRLHCGFSLPCGSSFSCSGATQACKSCYAQKGRFLFSNVQKKMAENWLLLRRLETNGQKSRLVDLLAEGIDDRLKVFRIHPSGDFISQSYLDAWTEVIRQKPSIQFFAFTRCFDLNYQKVVRLANFNLLASTDHYNQNRAIGFVKRYSKSSVHYAFGPWERNEMIPKHSVVCPVTNHRLVVDGACEVCRLCVDKGKTSKNIVLLRH